jgi:hypothetical protein
MEVQMPQFRPGFDIGEGNTLGSVRGDIMDRSGVNLRLEIKFWKLLVVENWVFFQGHVAGALLRDLCMIKKTALKLLD